MNKEIAIKVRVEGEEVTMAGKQLDAFKKTIENLKKQLTELGARTEENGEQFDKLKGDLDALNSTFNDTSTEVKTTTDNLDKNETQVVQNEKVTKSYAAEIRSLSIQLAQLGDRTVTNGAQYDALQQKIKNLRDKQEDLQFGTRKLDDALSAIPGSIGNIASKFKMFDDGLKNSKSALKGLTAQFPILKSAIVSTGIGALVIIFGLLAAAVMKAFQTFKPLQAAVGNLKTAFSLLEGIIQPVIDLIGKGLTIAVNAAGKAIAWLMGKTKEYNQQLADQKASDDFISASEQRIKQLKKESITAKGTNKEKIDNDIDYLEKKTALEKQYKDDGKKKDQSFNDEMELIELEHNQKITDINQNANKQRGDNQQQANQDAIQAQKDYLDRLLELNNENDVLMAKSDYEASKITLKQQYDAQQKEINQLKISETKKTELLDKLRGNYNLKSKQLDTEYLNDRQSTLMSLNLLTQQATAEDIQNERDRLLELERINNELALIEINKESDDDIRRQKRVLQATLYFNAIEKIEIDSAKKRAVQMLSNIQWNIKSRQLEYDTMLLMIENANINEIEKIKYKAFALKQINSENRSSELTDLQQLLTDKQITLEQALIRQDEIKVYYAKKEVDLNRQTYEQITSAIASYRSQLEGVSSTVSTVTSYYNGLATSLKKGSKEQENAAKTAKALTQVQLGLAAVTQSLALVEAFRGLAKDIGKGFPANVIAVASTLSLIAAAFVSFKQFAAGFKAPLVEGSSSGGSSTPNYGKNYESGGEIKGKRHAQGGTIIEAEDGEAIMNRGSVAMFKPMLSLMNQMGGGKAFDARVIQNDNPITKQPNQEPIILKTYVVSTEMTSEQEKTARLKNISTI